jgi:hypothetical protein
MAAERSAEDESNECGQRAAFRLGPRLELRRGSFLTLLSALAGAIIGSAASQRRCIYATLAGNRILRTRNAIALPLTGEEAPPHFGRRVEGAVDSSFAA